MKCNVIFYSSSADKRVVNKTSYITENMKLEGYFRDEVSLLSPTFQIECDEVPTSNYCYIDIFRRYYFINSIKLIRKKVFEISCSVDVLMTYSSYISNSSQYVSRQENKYNEMIVDNRVTFTEDYDYSITYQNIDELDYASNASDNKVPTDKTNIVLCVYGKQSDIVE